ncbi:DNL zinc finger family protein [Salpingoeca rosetta]|uniref:DNL zinc finger family protein n=1 Tax=Salpingoeca rosetta (strain ATCC 50818 / BSB-021) TaxID=946362 RepID=F2UL38_SALR5|nr:DNL zinc finger family protein [Salpingoeca rosetta]EGD77837.1 DNL zinc finger family protein [Salpingoeca rosetta]|eukprot:XP_004989901.1 DNL zinc finger family protein [Salpingoeca rosetta]
MLSRIFFNSVRHGDRQNDGDGDGDDDDARNSGCALLGGRYKHTPYSSGGNSSSSSSSSSATAAAAGTHDCVSTVVNTDSNWSWQQQKNKAKQLRLAAHTSANHNDNKGQALNEGTPLEGTYAVVFTCNKCGNRGSKTFSKQAYHNGVVIVNCPGCDAKHLIADNLGWFKGIGGGKNIEEMLKSKGESVRKQEHDGVVEVTAQDLQLAIEAKKTREAHDKNKTQTNAATTAAATPGHDK